MSQENQIPTPGDVHATAVYLANDTTLTILVAYKAITALLGIPLLILLCKHHKLIVVSTNAKLVLFGQGVHGFFQCITIFASELCTLIIMKTTSDPTYSGLFCMITRGSIAFFTVGIAYSLVLISLDRLIANLAREFYERIKCAIGVFIVFFTIFMPTFTTVYMVYDYDIVTPQAYCSIVTEKSMERILWIPDSIVLCDLIGLVILHGLIVKKWIRKRFRPNQVNIPGDKLLRQRYHSGENLRTLLAYIPLVWTHFVSNALATFGYSGYYKFFPWEAQRAPIVEEAVNFMHLYVPALPIVIYFLHKREKRKTETMFTRNGYINGRQDENAVQIMKDTYFQTLQNSWEISSTSKTLENSQRKVSSYTNNNSGSGSGALVI